jgi:hypothetical protein
MSSIHGSAVRIREHVRSVIDQDGAVLLDLKHGKYFGLSPVGAEIWLKLETGLTLPEIEAHLCRTYDAPAETLRRDLTVFVEHLRQAQLIELAG